MFYCDSCQKRRLLPLSTNVAANNCHFCGQFGAGYEVADEQAAQVNVDFFDALQKEAAKLNEDERYALFDREINHQGMILLRKFQTILGGSFFAKTFKNHLTGDCGIAIIAVNDAAQAMEQFLQENYPVEPTVAGGDVFDSEFIN